MNWQSVSPIISALTFLGVILMGLVNKLSSDKIANNHLAHVDVDLKEIKKEIKEDIKSEFKNLNTSISAIKEDIAYLKGKDAVTDKIVQYLKETK